MIPSTMSTESIDASKAAGILNALFLTTEGPKEAYGVLCLAIYLLNFDISDTPVSIDQLADEVSRSLKSIQAHKSS